MELPLAGRCSFNSTRIATKFDAARRGKCQLSFVLLFSSTRTFSTKRTISKFRSNSRRVTWNCLKRPSLPQSCADHNKTWCSGYVLVLAFICTTFQLHPSIFCQKNYLKFSLQFPAGHMEHGTFRVARFFPGTPYSV
jgi:hypothetical protein